MTNIDTYIKALQIKWILRLLENSNENWKIIPQKYFEKIGENFLIFNMNLDSFKSLKNVESCVIRVSFHCFGIAFFQNIQFRYPVLFVS
jgi:hypothetical protein